MKQLVSIENPGAGGKRRCMRVANPELVALCATEEPDWQATWLHTPIGSMYGQG